MLAMPPCPEANEPWRLSSTHHDHHSSRGRPEHPRERSRRVALRQADTRILHPPEPSLARLCSITAFLGCTCVLEY